MRGREKSKLKQRQTSFMNLIEKYNGEKWKYYEIHFEGRLTMSTKEGEIVEACSSTHDFQMNPNPHFPEKERMHIFK